MTTMHHSKRRGYPSDVTDAEWSRLDPIIPPEKLGPNPRKYDRREIVNAILYKCRTGCSWRMLPGDFPPWHTIARWFYWWRDDGTWERVNDFLRGEVRAGDGRELAPSLGIVDSQSVKSSHGGDAIGYDGNKKVRGRKRHILVDVLGMLVALSVTSADVQDRDALRDLVHEARTKSDRLVNVLVDGAYNGAAVDAVQEETGIAVTMVKRSDTTPGFVVLPKRWVVERTFGWLVYYRQLSREYDRTVASSETWTRIACATIALRRLG